MFLFSLFLKSYVLNYSGTMLELHSFSLSFFVQGFEPYISTLEVKSSTTQPRNCYYHHSS